MPVVQRLDKIEALRRDGIVTKKQLKEYINKHGSFYRMSVNVWSREEAMKNAPTAFDMGLMNQVPDDPDVYVFTGLASNGDLNRNGYKIDPKAWENEIPTYMTNPRVLLMHNMDNPIGNTLKAGVTARGLEVMGYAFDDYDMTKNGIRRGLYTALSTGHLTQEVMFENQKTMQRLSEKDFRNMVEEMHKRLTWDELTVALSEWILVVTKLDWLEYSFVSIPSNKASLVDSTQHMLNFIQLTDSTMKTKQNEVSSEKNAADSDESKKQEQDDEKKGDESEDEKKSDDSENESNDDTSKDESNKSDTSEKSDENSDAESNGEKSGVDKGDDDDEEEEDDEDDEAEVNMPISKDALAELKNDNEIVTSALSRLNGDKKKATAPKAESVNAYELLTDTVGKLGQLFIHMYATLKARNIELESRLEAIENVPRVKRAIQISEQAKAESGDGKAKVAANALNEDAKNILREAGIGNY